MKKKSRKPAITGLHSEGIIDDIFDTAGRAVVKQVRRNVRKINKSYKRTSGTMTGAGEIGEGLGLKPHVQGRPGKSNMSNPRFRKLVELEDATERAFIKQMGGRKKAGSKEYNKAVWEEFATVEKRAAKRAAARAKSAQKPSKKK